jgi:hypothetical protein
MEPCARVLTVHRENNEYIIKDLFNEKEETLNNLCLKMFYDSKHSWSIGDILEENYSKLFVTDRLT